MARNHECLCEEVGTQLWVLAKTLLFLDLEVLDQETCPISTASYGYLYTKLVFLSPWAMNHTAMMFIFHVIDGEITEIIRAARDPSPETLESWLEDV